MTDACPTCHVGLKQLNEFRFKSEPNAKHSQFLGLNWVFDQVFVRQPVEEIFIKEGVTGISFSTPVIHKTGKLMETIKQLHVDTKLNDALSIDKFEFEICEYPKEKSSIKFLTSMGGALLKGPFCGQKKFHYRPYKEFIFREHCFNNMPDFVRLNEWFGSGASAARPIFVSDKVYKLIKSFKWRGAFLEPVKFI